MPRHPIQSLDLDRTIYLVIVAHSGGAYFAETNVTEADLAGAIRVVEEADWDVHHVLCIQPEAGTCRDATAEIAEAIGEKLAREGEKPCCAEEAAFLDRFNVEYLTDGSLRRMGRPDYAEHSTYRTVNGSVA